MTLNSCKGKIYEWPNEKPCPRTVVPNSQWCIFHYPNKKSKLAEFFSNEFNNELIQQKKEHPDIFDFTGFDFPEDIKFNEDFETVYFQNAIFRKKVSFFSGITDPGLTFRGNANFRNTEFQADAIFTQATFQHHAIFDHAKFHGDAFFDYVEFRYVTEFIVTTFKRNAIFGFSIFKKDAKFRSAIFSGNSFFTYVDFLGETDFDRAEFHGFGDFFGAVFNQDSYFQNISINDIIHFQYITINKRLWLETNYVKKYRFAITMISEALFSEKGRIIIKGNIGIIEPNFLGGLIIRNTELNNFEFINEKWPVEYGTRNGRKILIDEIILRSKEEPEHESLEKSSPEQVAQTYRRLRENYENAKRYAEAGDFFIGEMEIIRKYSPSISNKILHSLYFHLAKYGESIRLPIVWGLLIIFILAEYNVMLFIKPSTELFFYEYQRSILFILKTFLPFSQIFNLTDTIIRLIGSLILGVLFIAVRRKLERK